MRIGERRHLPDCHGRADATTPPDSPIVEQGGSRAGKADPAKKMIPPGPRTWQDADAAKVPTTASQLEDPPNSEAIPPPSDPVRSRPQAHLPTGGGHRISGATSTTRAGTRGCSLGRMAHDQGPAAYRSTHLRPAHSDREVKEQSRGTASPIASGPALRSSGLVWAGRSVVPASWSMPSS
jgi:hypothetical protein